MNEVYQNHSINLLKYSNYRNINKITFGITREKTKKFCIWNYISNFFIKMII